MTETEVLQNEIEELRARLNEAEETLEAIRTGQVDAVVVQGPEGHAVYTLTGAERTYRLLVEAMNEGALVLDPNGSIIYSNHTFSAMLGLPLEQVIGSSVYDYVAPPDSDVVRQLLQQAVWAPGRREISLSKEDQTQVPAHISVASLDVEEAAESLSAVVTDLTEHKALECELEQYRVHLEELVEQRTAQLKEAVEDLKVEIEARKRAEEAVAAVNEELQASNQELQMEVFERQRAEAEARHSEEMLRFASTAADIGTWHWDQRTGELDWSDRCKMLFGLPLDFHMTYDGFLRAVYDEDRARIDAAVRRALEDGSDYSVEMRVPRPDGTLGWVMAKGRGFYDASGKPVAMDGIAMDISARKEIEREKDDLLRREHRIAEALQGALIPSQIPRAIEAWSVAARYRPALREAQVGGDFYDVFRLDDKRFGVIIGDIAGKGLAAAISVAAVRHAIRSYAYVEPSPARVMTLANDAICREGTDEQNVLTCVFGVVDVANNLLSYANAGHEPPVVRTSEGEIGELAVTGPMLGVVAGFAYQERTCQMNPGDEIVMFTDGITEARTDTDLFDREGVVESLTKVGDAAPDEIAEALLQAAIAHAGGDLQDDAAIVILAYEGMKNG